MIHEKLSHLQIMGKYCTVQSSIFYQISTKSVASENKFKISDEFEMQLDGIISVKSYLPFFECFLDMLRLR